MKKKYWYYDYDIHDTCYFAETLGWTPPDVPKHPLLCRVTIIEQSASEFLETQGYEICYDYTYQHDTTKEVVRRLQ